MATTKWNQFSNLASSKNWIHHFLSEADDFLKMREWDQKNEVPPFTIHENEDFLFLDIVAPGMKNEDITVVVDHGILVINALMKDENPDGCVASYSNFRRSFWLPSSVNPNKIAAKYKEGLLMLRLPKGNSSSLGYTKVIPVV